MTTITPQNYPDLPEDPDPGEYQCGDCGARVTVNSDGREFGHKRSYSSGQDHEDCPRRDPALNPTDPARGGA